VVIEVMGGGYAVEDDEEQAFARASGRAEPDALFFFTRVGKNSAPVPARRIGAF
jgi:hypothetical protein